MGGILLSNPQKNTRSKSPGAATAIHALSCEFKQVTEGKKHKKDGASSTTNTKKEKEPKVQQKTSTTTKAR